MSGKTYAKRFGGRGGLGSPMVNRLEIAVLVATLAAGVAAGILLGSFVLGFFAVAGAGVLMLLALELLGPDSQGGLLERARNRLHATLNS